MKKSQKTSKGWEYIRDRFFEKMLYNFVLVKIVVPLARNNKHLKNASWEFEKYLIEEMEKYDEGR